MLMSFDKPASSLFVIFLMLATELKFLKEQHGEDVFQNPQSGHKPPNQEYHADEVADFVKVHSRIVRILLHKGKRTKHVGTGILMSKTYVLTALHVQAEIEGDLGPFKAKYPIKESPDNDRDVHEDVYLEAQVNCLSVDDLDKQEKVIVKKVLTNRFP